MQKSKSYSVKQMVMLALLAAIAYMMVSLIRIPVVLFLKYEPKDVIITIGGFLFGPMASFVVSLLVSLIEMVTISSRDTSRETVKEAMGPNRKPPMVMMTSLGSYFRNRTTGIRTRLTII